MRNLLTKKLLHSKLNLVSLVSGHSQIWLRALQWIVLYSREKRVQKEVMQFHLEDGRVQKLLHEQHWSDQLFRRALLHFRTVS